MLRFAFSGLNYVTLERVVYEYRQHPDSLTMGDNLQNREKSAADHIKITDIYLPNKTLPAPARALLLQVRTRVTLEMAVRFSKVLRFDKATRYMLVGLRYDPAWLFKLFGRIYQDLIH